MASSSSQPSINWADLPTELASSILLRLSTIEILENAQKVCRSWRRVCKDPSMWRKIDMSNNGVFGYNFEGMCRYAVDLSEGGLVEINLEHYGSDSLFSYIAERSNNLRRLRIEMSHTLTGKGFVNAVTKLPFLEDLEIIYPCSQMDLEAIGHSCPLLKILKLNCPSSDAFLECDDEARAIAETMPELRHLELFGNRLTNSGLNAILDSCLHLEHLDLRCCFYINLVGDLEKRCSESIRDFRRPHDSTDDSPFDGISDIISSGESDYYSDDSDDNGYPYYD